MYDIESFLGTHLEGLREEGGPAILPNWNIVLALFLGPTIIRFSPTSLSVLKRLFGDETAPDGIGGDA